MTDPALVAKKLATMAVVRDVLEHRLVDLERFVALVRKRLPG